MDYYIFMEEAIKEAKKAEALGDVPVGAVAVKDGIIIGRGHNKKEIENDPAGHAEIAALKEAAAAVNNWRLSEVTLFVTMEPCPMCAGAILQARIKTLVFGAWDMNWGACGFQAESFGAEQIQPQHRSHRRHQGKRMCRFNGEFFPKTQK